MKLAAAVCLTLTLALPALADDRPLAKPQPKASTQDVQPEVSAPPPQQDDAQEPNLRESLRASPFDHSACLYALHMLGTSFTELLPITEDASPDCGIVQPVKISHILPGIALAGEPVMRCDTARQLALWMRDSVRPAALFLPGSPRIMGVEPGSTYQCRDVVGGGSNKISEHALGNAFDIAAFTLDNGERFVIQPREDSGTIEIAFQAAIRASACLYFTTVLGPGSNAAHDDHLHLDIKARKDGWRLCQ